MTNKNTIEDGVDESAFPQKPKWKNWNKSILKKLRSLNLKNMKALNEKLPFDPEGPSCCPDHHIEDAKSHKKKKKTN